MSTNRDMVEALAYSQAKYVRTEPFDTPSAATEYTVTTTPDDGTTTIDLKKLYNNQTPYVTPERVEKWEAQLCARGGEIIVITNRRPRWYERIAARALGLEWRWELAIYNEHFGGMQLSWTPCGDGAVGTCIAGEDLALGSVVVNNDGIATFARESLPKPCSPEGCDICRGPGHCNLFPECSPDCTEKHQLRGEES